MLRWSPSYTILLLRARRHLPDNVKYGGHRSIEYVYRGTGTETALASHYLERTSVLDDEVIPLPLNGFDAEMARVIREAIARVPARYCVNVPRFMSGPPRSWYIQDPSGEAAHYRSERRAIIFNPDYADPSKIRAEFGVRVPKGVHPHAYVAVHELAHAVAAQTDFYETLYVPFIDRFGLGCMERVDPEKRAREMMAAYQALPTGERAVFELAVAEDQPYDATDLERMRLYFSRPQSMPNEDFADTFAWSILALEELHQRRPHRAEWFEQHL